MELVAASSSGEGGHPRKRQKQGDEGDRPSRHQAQRNGIIAGDQADITLRDQFFGGHHHHQHGIPPISDSATSSSEALIKSLSFPTMNTRRDYISEECPHTCEWLLDTAEWTQWRRSFEVAEYPRLLWIKGHAGSGKSTIMKYAYGNALKRGNHGKEIVLAHFFNARAKEKIDKSTEGMYRTILVQLLEALQTTNVPGEVARRALGGQVDWHIENLLELFRDLLRAHVDRPVTCFVDALDECDDDQVRDMIRSFRDLIEKKSKGVRVQLRVLFSSRHYPQISTPPSEKAICMALEGQPGHARDIINYIESYLLVHDSPIAQEVIVGVQKKAKGSFIWCKLVIDLLNKDNDEARLDRLLYLRERLAAVPAGLDALLAEILGMDGEGRVSDPETILCMQWVLFSMRELTPQELWWATRRGVEPQAESTELAARCRPEYLKRYILRASKGLVEIVEVERGKPIVQVIHESVRDFLLGQGKMAKLIGLEACKEEVVAHSHEQMKLICWDELFVHASHISIPQTVLDNIHGDDADELRGKLAKELPLLWYATQQMVKHANAAQRSGVARMNQQQFLDDLELHREQFNRLRIAYSNRPRDSLSGKVDTTLTGILLYTNAEALIELQYRRLDAAGVATHRLGLEAGFGVGQALRQGVCGEAVVAVVDVHRRRHSLGDPRRDLLLTIAPKPPFDGDSKAYRFRDPLLILADTNPHLGLFFLVAALPVTHKATDLLATQPQSILRDFNSLLSFVLADPLVFEQFQDSLDLEEALRWAAHQEDIFMAQVLLNRSHVDISSSSKNRMTPLHYAAMNGHETTVKFLLAGDGIEPDSRNDVNESPLHLACCFPMFSSSPNEDKEIAACNIVRRLLATGRADVNTRSNHLDITPLHIAADFKGKQLVEALLAAPGVNVNSRNSDGENPLHYAVFRHSAEVVELLLAAPGVDANARSSIGEAPLHCAVERGDAEVVGLLLAVPDVDVDARDRDGKTPLHISASRSWGQSIAEMLLSTRKVDVNARTKNGKTPRDLAVKLANRDTAKLLADYGGG